MVNADSLQADVVEGAKRTFCSLGSGCRTVLVRAYEEPLHTDAFTTTVTQDLKLVLVTAGSCEIEARGSQGRWNSASYRPGHVGLVAPGEAAHLRWRGRERHHTLQIHIPGTVVSTIAEDLFGPRHHRIGGLHRLSLVDPVVATTMLSLMHAAHGRAPDLHAETTAHFLASHLLLRHSRRDGRPAALPDATALQRVEDHMRAHLGRPISLAELAGLAGVSRFQLLRMAKRVWGETPQRHLTRLRMDLAQRLLLANRVTVLEVALDCGYGNPAHFATAFRRFTGLSPSAFARGA